MTTKPFIGLDERNQFLFDISKLIKLMYETPVLFLTEKDYSEDIFKEVCDLYTTLQTDNKTKLMDIIVDCHLQWLHAVKDIENFRKLIKNLTKGEISQAISFTIDTMQSRLKFYEQFMILHRKSLPNEVQANITSDVEIVEEMHQEVVRTLMDKLKCFRNYDSQYTFMLKVNDSADELLQWLDKIYDNLAMLLSNYVNVNIPHLPADLTKTLQNIVGDIQLPKSPRAQNHAQGTKKSTKEIGAMVRSTTDHSLEICKVLNKIHILQDRITRLENEPISAALMALKHKKEYLEKRLSSLENVKINLKDIQDATALKIDTNVESEEELCVCDDFYQLRIFNHELPLEERERLVTELCYLWDLAVFGDRSHKSIISILSVADIKEEFTDELGTYHVDEHSRKIYKLPNDDTKYQPNENNDLVPLTDDADHIYYYDECGRYFVDQNTRQRVYKALETTSEYMMSSAGVLLKTKEERDGITFYYDNYGRYYINNEGKNIYREVDSQSEYENDGFGNLVRIRSHSDLFDTCPEEEHVTEDFNYIKQNVGKALRECIAQVILHQPSDPVKFLSACLLKYRENIELKDKRAREKELMNVERDLRIIEERNKIEIAEREAACLEQGGSEASYDSNLRKYTSMQPETDECTSLDAITK